MENVFIIISRWFDHSMATIIEKDEIFLTLY
jgi:hypothetical protein